MQQTPIISVFPRFLMPTVTTQGDGNPREEKNLVIASSRKQSRTIWHTYTCRDLSFFYRQTYTHNLCRIG